MIEQDLMSFVPTGPAPLKILCLESSLYLSRLRQNLPNAELWAMTAWVDEIGDFCDAKIKLMGGDYRRDAWPNCESGFDLVIAETCMANLWEPYETLMHISRCLKDTGCFLGCFNNIRHYEILATLAEGKFPYREERLYAKDEVVKMLNDAIFKEIDFAPFGHIPTAEERKSGREWERLGFDNYNDDLCVAVWMFRAARSTAAVTALKEMYTPAVRTKLVRLLRRLEYGIEPEQNLAELKKLCVDEMIFPDYLRDFIDQTIVHKQNLILNGVNCFTVGNAD